MKRYAIGLAVLFPVWTAILASAAEPLTPPLSQWKDRLTLHASFDQSADAEYSAGDGRIYTASDMSREHVQAGIGVDAVALSGDGRWGRCLQFRDVTDSVVFFKGERNIVFSDSKFGMTISFWMRLSPDKDLKPGYVDPLQITDKQWNNASLFVDFTKDDRPRHFRLGVFSDYKFWNPKDTAWDEITADDRPLITVKKTPFRRDRWTHVAITLDNLNAKNENSVARLYLDGQLQGELSRPQKLTWQSDRLAIMLGIQYVGDLDDFAIFSGAMNAREVGQLFGLKSGVATIR